MSLNVRPLIGPASLMLVIGCSQTRSYQLTIRNDTPGPVSVCRVKEGGPAEPGWESPEELAAPNHPADEDTPPGRVIPPKSTVTSKATTGTFASSGKAVLRFYAGAPDLNGMLAISPTSPHRKDVVLHEGLNRLVVTVDDKGKLTVTRAEATE